MAGVRPASSFSSLISHIALTSLTAQMMIGAVGWGTISDLLGRALPFNSTLLLTAVFGIGASFAPSFGVLCGWMFLLGSAVG
jgi:MFS family permease